MKKRRKSLIFRATMSVAALMLLACASFAMCTHPARAAQNVEGTYVVYNARDETLVFNYGTYTEDAYTKGISDIQYTSATLNNRPWAAWVTNVTQITTTDTFRQNFNPCHLSYWFYGCTNLSIVLLVDPLERVSWQQVSDMNGMFDGCTELVELRMNLIASSPSEMQNAFRGCTNLRSLVIDKAFRFQQDASFSWTGSQGMYWASNLSTGMNIKGGENAAAWNAALDSLVTLDTTQGFSNITFSLCNAQIILDGNGGQAYVGDTLTIPTCVYYGVQGESFAYRTTCLFGRLGYSLDYWSESPEASSPQVEIPAVFPASDLSHYYIQWKSGGPYCYIDNNGALIYAYGKDIVPTENVWPVYGENLYAFGPATLKTYYDKDFTIVSFDSSCVVDGISSLELTFTSALFHSENIEEPIPLSHVLGLSYLPNAGDEEIKEGELMPAFMFFNCSQLKTIDMSGWDIEFINGETEDEANYYWMFKGASSLYTLDMRDVYSSYTSAQPDETRSPLFDGCDNLNELIMSDTAGFALQFPVSNEWSAYYNGALQTGANLTTQEGVNVYFQNHPGVTYFVKQGKEATTSFVANGGTFADGEVAYDQTQTIGANSITLPETPTRPGYYFWGWADTEDAQRRTLDPKNLPNLIIARTTYYAVWGTTPAPPDPEPTPTDTVTITFRTDEGSWAGITESTREGTPDAAIIAPVYPTVDATRTCIGWFDEAGKEVVSGITTFDEVTGVVTARFVDTPGWHQNNTGWWYVYDLSNNYYTNCWALINSAWFYFNDAGYCLEYTWGYIGGEWYFFGWGGYMQTGWQWLGGSWYFLDRINGNMHTGWVHDGVWYYCDATLGGAMYDNCWAYINGNWYGFNEGGSMTQGWSWSYTYDGWFYLEPYTGVMQIGWQYIGGHWYYFYDNGLMAANTYVGNYWLGADGAMW